MRDSFASRDARTRLSVYSVRSCSRTAVGAWRVEANARGGGGLYALSGLIGTLLGGPVGVYAQRCSFNNWPGHGGALYQHLIPSTRRSLAQAEKHLQCHRSRKSAPAMNCQ